MYGADADFFDDIHHPDDDQTHNAVRRILFVSSRGNLWHGALSEPEYLIDLVDDLSLPSRRLSDSTHDLIVLDEASFGNAIHQAISECKRLNLLLPVLVLTDNESLDDQVSLMDAGADDVLLTSCSPDYLKRKLDVHVRRGQQNRVSARRNRKLYEIAMLTGQLHAHTEPQTLIQETIRTVIQTFSLYGAGIAIPENGILRIFSGQMQHQKANPILQTLHDPDPEEPFNRVLQTGHVEFFEDITLDLHYAPLPMLPQVGSAILVPLKVQAEIMGVIAVFGRPDEPVSIEDVVIYEMLAAQIAGTLQNANYAKAQHVRIHTNQTLLTAWQTLLTAQTSSGIVQTLCQLVEVLPSVDGALIWINGQEPDQIEVYSTDPQGSAEQVFSDYLHQADMDDLIRKISAGPHIVFQLGLSGNDPLSPLFRALRARQLIFMSIEDSTRMIGGILTSVSNDRQFSLEDANLVRSLSYATGQALERMMLIDAMQEKSGRLEAILRSITEGVFFVDGDGKIAFCNPQLTELTSLIPSEILGQRPEVLLDLLAEQAMNPDTAREHFYNAIHTLQSWQGNDRSYPIVELTLRNNWQSVHVEFVAFERPAEARQSWIGIVGASIRNVSRWDTPSEATDLLLHSLHASGTQVNSLIDQVVQSRTRYDDFEQMQHLEALQQGTTNFRLLLEQYAKFYNINMRETDGNVETVDLSELVQEVVRKQPEWSKLRIHLDPASPSAAVEVNRSLIERALVRLLESVVQQAAESRSITLSVSDREPQVHLSVEFFDLRELQAGEWTPFDLIGTRDPTNAWADIYLYYALTQFHHCRIWSENRADHQHAVMISLPKSQRSSIPLRREDQAEVIEVAASGAGAPQRSPRAVMMITGLSPIISILAKGLEEQGYDLISYDIAEEAIRDINLTRFDLVVIDGQRNEQPSLEIYKQLRRRTEVPVVIVASKATNQERIAALKAGVDDYITEPISREELLAKISVLFKRQHLADRTEQPLDTGDLRIDFARRAVWVGHKPITLTRIEYDLLRTLAVNMGQVLTHQQLLEKVWGPEYRSETQYLWVNISRLRKKLEPTNHIYNQQGIGYIFQNM